jgi:hypothetical protein
MRIHPSDTGTCDTQLVAHGAFMALNGVQNIRRPVDRLLALAAVLHMAAL